MSVYPRPGFPHLARAIRARLWQRCKPHLALLAAIALTLVACLIGASNANSQEIVTYGPWKGYWKEARLSAYSPHDAIDAEYHATKGERWRWICADGKTDVRHEPYGIAAPSSVRFGTRIFVPTGHGYLDSSRAEVHQRIFTVTDRGGLIERRSVPGEVFCLDLRYRTTESALAFGVKDALVFIIVD